MSFRFVAGRGASLASCGTAPKLAAAPAEATGSDRLGSFESIGAAFEGGGSAACALFAEIRYYKATDAFVFAANFAPQAVPRVNSTELLQQASAETSTGSKPPAGPQDMPGLATAFPTWPQGGAASQCEYYSYQGNSLGSNWRAGLLSTWTGGLQAGPLLLFPAAVRALPGRLGALSVSHSKSILYGGFVWASRTLNRQKWWAVLRCSPAGDGALAPHARQGHDRQPGRQAGLLTQGVPGFPQGPLTPRRGPLGPSLDRESAIGNAPALAPGPLARLQGLRLLTELSPQAPRPRPR